ncbi:DNA topoisomerase II large subunit [Acinetobacter phage vB_AbaM_Konradin]|uniref:DNA topoisomerase (ATP-hydrolyzing) n=1 Tax=Acinetobacter phage vB_AbaM_Konradin TaxID=2666257 RepID=A0A650EUK2_9CAUD|nr:DNA topoisomerase II large subunit [Acinetobacter phage vB_AbaM_Konradin]QGT53776.1 DNA topoisomerase II large subunit [Acinetobacter phage vB_AbaM_Konradin]
MSTEIKMLSDREHVLKRPGMYVGSTTSENHDRFLFGKFQTLKYVPALVKIIDEIIDNSLDEAIRTDFAFANKIEVKISGNQITVKDNGRGIPQAMITTPEGTQLPGAVACWTRTKAGGNFGDDATRKTAGLNGVGSSLTNIFSKEFIGTTCDGENTIVVKCSDNMSNIDWKTKAGGKQGTEVSFVPDFSLLDCDGIDSTIEQIVEDRLQILAVIYPDIQFKFNNVRVLGNFKKYAKMYDEDAIIMETDNVQLAIGRSDDGFRHLSFVNAIHTKVGGSHIDYVIDELANELIPQIKRRHKVEVNKARIKECLTMLLFIKNMSNMRFDSQTKERLTSPWGEVKAHIDIDIKKLARMLIANESILMPIIEAVLAKLLAAEKAANTRAAKKAAKAKVAKHIKANKYGDDTVETTLFLTEGDSAIGYLISTRDRELHGGYPLRGKVMNTWGMTPAEMLKNKEIFDICAITGLTIGEPAENLNYRNIAIMTDADVDGTGSIYPSLLAFFSNWPELFEQGRIKFVKTPVAICQKGKDQKWYYTIDEYETDKPNLKGYGFRYIKGLGSLEMEEYEKVIREPHFDVVKLPENWKAQFEMLFGNDAQLRKDWMSA